MVIEKKKHKRKKHPLSHAREVALQGLYQIELKSQSRAEVLQFSWLNQEMDAIKKEFSVYLIIQVTDNIGALDLAIHVHSKKHRTQLSSITRCALRMAIFELQNGDLHPAIVIDEYLELVRKYDNEDAVPFVNGVLDAYRSDSETINDHGQNEKDES